MAKKATNTKPLAVNRRSHALNTYKTFQKPNLQKVTVNGKTVRMTAREIRTLNKASKKADVNA